MLLLRRGRPRQHARTSILSQGFPRSLSSESSSSDDDSPSQLRVGVSRSVDSVARIGKAVADIGKDVSCTVASGLAKGALGVVDISQAPGDIATVANGLARGAVDVSQAVGDMVFAAADIGKDMGSNLASGLVKGASWFNMPVDVKWQFQNRSSFKDYLDAQSQKIELTYQMGYSMVRIKSGKSRGTPLEIYFTDMIQYDPINGKKRSVQRVGPSGLRFRIKRLVNELYVSWCKGLPWRETCEQYQTRRQYTNRGTHATLELYHKTGLFQRIARSQAFYIVTMSLVIFNSIWLWYEADFDKSSTWSDAPIQFTVLRNVFATVFTVDISIRFLAFERKRNCLRDLWFCLDFLLVLFSILEVWLIPLFVFIVDGTQEGAGGLRIWSGFRVLRLARIARAARLFSLAPELVTLLRAIYTALLSLFYTAVLLVILLFVFSILVRTQMVVIDDDELAATYFPDCWTTFWNLFAYGTLVDSPSVILLRDLVVRSQTTALYLIVFILLSNFMILTLLIAIVCETVTCAKHAADEKAEHFLLRTRLLDLLDVYDHNGNQHLCKHECLTLIKNPETAELFSTFGSDVNAFISLLDVIYPHKDDEISFDEFIDYLLLLRGEHHIKVIDLILFREYVRSKCDKIAGILKQILRLGVNGEASHLATRTSHKDVVCLVDSMRQDTLPLIDVCLHLQGDDQVVVERHHPKTTVGYLLNGVPILLGRRVAVGETHNVIDKGTTLETLVKDVSKSEHLPLHLFLVFEPEDLPLRLETP